MDYYGDSSGGPHQHHGAYNWPVASQYDAYGGGQPLPPPPHYVLPPPPSAQNPSAVPQPVQPVLVDEPMAQDDQATLLNPQEIQEDCLVKFGRQDYIMEPGIFNQLKRYFQSGGNPEQVIDLLSTNYLAYAQMANLMAEWIISAGNQVLLFKLKNVYHLWSFHIH